MADAAKDWAAANGGTVLTGPFTGAAAQSASAAYAQSAVGTVHSFQTALSPTPLDLPLIWRFVEYPILVDQGNPIVYHVLGPSGWVVFPP